MNCFRIVILTIIISLTSCASKKKIAYFQDVKEDLRMMNYEPILQTDDVLMIVISSVNPEVAAPYNLKTVILQSNSEISLAQERLQSYLIDQEGNIEFPVIGKVHLAGLTRTQGVELIKEKLNSHIKDPVVNLRILNYKISVLGEVNKPGVYPLQSERITLLEAISLAGDLSIYGKRTDVLVIREDEGVKTINKIDLTNSDFINSDFYYLNQNDVVYVEPNKTKVNSSIIGPNVAIGISAASLLVTILALTIR
ncbi:MAG: polysaccharide biosynthesis/export family protein [Flavobacterium sp.]